MFKMLLCHAHIALALLTFSMQVTGDDNAQVRSTVSTTPTTTVNKGSHQISGTSPDAGKGGGGKGNGSSHPVGEHEGGMELTPWWPLTMATGETVSIDCGVYRGGRSEGGASLSSEPKISWMDQKTRDMCDTNDPRINCTLRVKNHETDTKPGAYKVLTLTITNLSLSDTGMYECVSNRKANNTVTSNIKEILLTVHPSDTLCTFEGKEMCGWRNVNTTSLQWRRHDAAEEYSINRSKGLRYDHTFGASKHTGHMVDIDIARDKPTPGATARLQSPPITQHSHERCLQFWYIHYAKDPEYLRVILKNASNLNEGHSTEESNQEQKEDKKILKHLDISSIDNVWAGEWTLQTLEIPAQTDDYVIIFEAMMCKQRCKSGSIAIDDVRFYESTCSSVKSSANDTWPDRRLKVRLLGGKKEDEGRVEILHDGMWGSICSTKFGNNDAKVICRSLGFKSDGAIARRISAFGQAADDVIIWLQKLGCSGSEKHLGSCIAKNETWGGTETCSHAEDASVICGDPDILPYVMDTTTSGHKVTTQIMTTEGTHPDTTLPTIPSTEEIKTTSESTPTSEVTSATTTPTSTTSTTPRKTSVGPSSSTASRLTEETPGDESLKISTEGTLRESTQGGSTENGSSADSGWTEEPVQMKRQKPNTGAAVGISLTILILTAAAGVWVYRRRKNRRKSKYIVFSNPKYSREHLPANDISLDSPLTSGSSILA